MPTSESSQPAQTVDKNGAAPDEAGRLAREQIFESTLSYFLGPIGPHLRDDSVTEIMVNGYNEVYVERAGRLYQTESRFASEDALRSAIHNVAQYVDREIDEDRPILDARLPDGSRVHAVIPPSARLGTYLTIRKFKRDIYSLDDFVRLDSLSAATMEFLRICVRLRKNIVVAGGTGTGKTTFLNGLSTAIPREERIVVIEDSSELRLAQPHTLYLESQQADAYGHGGVNIRQLFKASLRMRPDRIIVGEVRGGEALDMVQSMISGHSGSMTTVHATSPRDALVRLETLSLMSDVELPVYVARAQAASAINVVVQLTRFTEDGSRKVTRITEQHGLDAENRYQFRDLFISRLKGRTPDDRLIAELEPTGEQPSFASEPYEQGMDDSIRLTSDLWSTSRV
ncbi:MAG: CpaF family protein [Planctomycetota bacterium]|nr:MAG: CpaF family protein [Planctomycetota bacterium]REK21562.1 MAG: CpaF family protein [Planctomycetota bacterium]REK39884.1 MAG: CpaF family protein [Planctomycetota bacterium]